MEEKFEEKFEKMEEKFGDKFEKMEKKFGDKFEKLEEKISGQLSGLRQDMIYVLGLSSLGRLKPEITSDPSGKPAPP